MTTRRGYARRYLTAPGAGGASLIGILPDMRILDPGVPDPKSEGSDRLTYQVTFWQRFAEPGQVPPEHGPFLSDVWQMTDTDVKEVIAWADTQAKPWQTYQIHVAVVDANPAVGLLCLYGINPVPGYGPA
jgi:hypothetical protein